MNGTWAVYYSRRCSQGVPDGHVWVVCPWNATVRQDFVGAFRFVVLNTPCLLIQPKKETKWPAGTLVISGYFHDNGDGTAYIAEACDGK